MRGTFREMGISAMVAVATFATGPTFAAAPPPYFAVDKDGAEVLVQPQETGGFFITDDTGYEWQLKPQPGGGFAVIAAPREWPLETYKVQTVEAFAKKIGGEAKAEKIEAFEAAGEARLKANKATDAAEELAAAKTEAAKAEWKAKLEAATTEAAEAKQKAEKAKIQWEKARVHAGH